MPFIRRTLICCCIYTNLLHPVVITELHLQTLIVAVYVAACVTGEPPRQHGRVVPDIREGTRCHHGLVNETLADCGRRTQ